MLNQHETAARNRKVREIAAYNLYRELYVEVDFESRARLEERKRQASAATPRMNPADRTWHRPPHVPKARNRVNAKLKLPCSMPSINRVREYLRGE